MATNRIIKHNKVGPQGPTHWRPHSTAGFHLRHRGGGLPERDPPGLEPDPPCSREEAAPRCPWRPPLLGERGRRGSTGSAEMMGRAGRSRGGHRCQVDEAGPHAAGRTTPSRRLRAVRGQGLSYRCLEEGRPDAAGPRAPSSPSGGGCQADPGPVHRCLHCIGGGQADLTPACRFAVEREGA